MLIAAWTAWKAGAAAMTRTSAVLCGAVTAAKAGDAFRNPWGTATGAAAGATVRFIAPIHAPPARPIAHQQATA